MFESVTATSATVRATVAKERASHVGHLIEYILMVILLFCLTLTAYFFAANGYIPQPFYYIVDESLMDLYSTAIWAHHKGAYSIWHSVYPPLSFDLLRLVTNARCYAGDAAMARQCDPLAAVVLCGNCVVNAGLAFWSYRLSDSRTAIPRAVAVSLGLPMLYALERGNLLIPCFTAFVLGAGPLVRSPVWRTVFLAVSVNFKPYLLAVFLPAVARRDWRWLLGFGAAGLAVYLATFALEGAGTPMQLLTDMGGYAGGKHDAWWANLYYSTSYWPVVRVLASHGAFASGFSPGVAAACGFVIVGAMRLVQLGSLICMLCAIARPAGVDARRFMALYAALILTTVTNGSSGYTLIFLFFLIFFEPWRGPVRIAILLSTYLLCLPVDWAFWPVIGGPAHSFLGGRDVMVSYGVSVGQILRPGLLLVIQFGLIALNLQDIWAGARKPVAPIIAPASVAGASPTL